MDKKGATIKQTDAADVISESGSAPHPGLVAVFSGSRPQWQLMPMPEREIELGRENLGNLLGDSRISRRHARVVLQDGTFSATDLGSLNGTSIDGHAVPPTVSRPIGRCLRVGDTLLLPVADVRPFQSAGITVQGGVVIGPQLFHLYQRIGRAAASSKTLFITGESGAGKENAARAFHSASSDSRGPFVAVNCATIPEGIAERLLFGAKRGAFSGVVADTDGYIQAANHGTLFLDEIAELHATVQAKLLRVLETHEVLAVGAVRAQPVSLRVVSASHRSLYGEVASGRLREDLYYRIGRPAERVPALRERAEEIPWLIAGELQKAVGSPSPHVSLIESCILRDWPGNIRELLVEVRSAAQEAIAGESQRVKVEHLAPSAGLRIKDPNPSSTPSLPAPTPSAASSSSPSHPSAPGGTASKAEPPSRARILAALIETNGNIAAAARELSLHRTQLRRQIVYYGIDLNRLREVGKT